MPNATGRRAPALGRIAAVIGAAGLVAVALTACSTDPNTDCGTALPSGKASQLVEATGKIGSKPKITVPTPLDTTKSERSIITEGTGEQVHKGQVVEIQYTILDGKTGQVQQTSYGSGDTYPLALGSGNAALSKGLQCAPVGSRVAVVISPKDAGGSGATSSGVLVVDILKAYLAKADGAVRPSVSGFPTVVLAPTGQPGITIPSSGGAPKKLRTEELKAGDGATVKKDSIAVLQYTAVGWENKNVVFSSWQSGSPDIVSIGTGQSQLNQALPQSVLGQLVGKKVGSQVVVEAPAEGQVPAAAWVVDILGVR
ncbi:FKBP-type peptidyl-prolyl cis-trans isomerase [Leifsonia virtsii]|uniref:Peptidylprolyl isomerase n=1 Tax=Leifsonia virtsii TaxID=3035915 RepID=A0ABT8ITK4_9MICO|nr:peptidylprolyl isomerase [Leifsonia virtsii]MDN4596120.1 peptidylprolyl isomerase [Leifsonia virtsii]